MKKIIILILLTVHYILYPVSYVSAASPSPSPKPTTSPTTSPTQEKAKELKEKVASKIAELKILQKRAFLGTIKSITDKSLILSTQNKDITIEIDSNTTITSLSKSVRKSLKITDLAKDQKILAWGQYNKEEEVLTAKNILVRVFSLNLHGTVKSIEKNSLTILEKSENKEYTIDVATAKIRSLKNDKSLGKIEAKDIAENDFVHVYVTPKTEGDKTTYTAWRVLILPKSIIENLSKETPNPTATSKITPKPEP